MPAETAEGTIPTQLKLILMKIIKALSLKIQSNLHVSSVVPENFR